MENRFNEAFVDLAAIAHNVEKGIARQAGKPYFGDFRADAYGHGQRASAAARDAGALEPVGGSPVTAELYGLFTGDGLLPAMRVSGRVVAIKTIRAGEGVSYGYTYRAPFRTNLALVSLGYADGLPRSAGNIATLQLSGKARRIAGRVAMNALVLELREDTAELGEEAVVFGDPRKDEPSLDSWVESVGGTAAEAVTVFGSHLSRRYSNGRS